MHDEQWRKADVYFNPQLNVIVIIVTVGRTVEHLKKELQQKGDIGLVAEVSLLNYHVKCYIQFPFDLIWSNKIICRWLATKSGI